MMYRTEKKNEWKVGRMPQEEGMYKVNKARRVDGVAGGRTHNIRDSIQKGAEVMHTQEGQPGLVHTDS